MFTKLLRAFARRYAKPPQLVILIMLSPSMKNQFEILEKAETDIFKWAKEEGIKLYHMEFVPSHYESNGGHTIFFYETDADLNLYNKSGVTSQVISQYFSFLRIHGYSEDDIKRNSVNFDSDENVKKNYRGSYFLRMR